MNATPLHRFAAFRVTPDSLQLEKTALLIAASLEAQASESQTDLAQVAQANAVLPVSVDHYQEYPGRGVGGLIQLTLDSAPLPVLFGSKDFLIQCNLSIPELLESAIREWETQPGTLLRFLGWEGSVHAVFQFKADA